MNCTESFICTHCGTPVSTLAWGTKHRNHCPHCLYSMHVDIKVGDRACLCRGEMEPIALWQKDDGELMIIHRCKTCGMIKSNRVAGDDEIGALQALLPKLVV
mgnify:CR=1 FL=1